MSFFYFECQVCNLWEPLIYLKKKKILSWNLFFLFSNNLSNLALLQIRVQAVDVGGKSATAFVDVTVNRNQFAPAFTSTTVNANLISENQAVGVSIAQVTCTDSDDLVCRTMALWISDHLTKYSQCFQSSGFIRKSGHFPIWLRSFWKFFEKSGHFCVYWAAKNPPDPALKNRPDLLLSFRLPKCWHLDSQWKGIFSCALRAHNA